MKHLLLTTIAAVLLVGCGESQQTTTDYVDPHVAEYNPNESWGLSGEEKAAEEAARKPQPEPPTAKAPDISIQEAAEEGNIEAIKQHLAAGTDVKAEGRDGWTPLHNAARNGHKEIVELLIAKGADVDAKDEDGWTPLHWATVNGHEATVELLLANGSNVNANDNDGETPLDWADGGIANLLRKNGGKIGEELKAEGK